MRGGLRRTRSKRFLECVHIGLSDERAMLDERLASHSASAERNQTTGKNACPTTGRNAGATNVEPCPADCVMAPGDHMARSRDRCYHPCAMKFTKMHGIGNDYVYVDCFASSRPPTPPPLAQKVADRHFGIGGDGLILICPSDKADARMRMFNADGSESEMCGNGVRCVAKYVYDHGLARRATR